MANAVFDPERALGMKITDMDRQELCEFVCALCRSVVSEVGVNGRRGGIFPENISTDDSGSIAVGPASEGEWEGQELQFIAPEVYWKGPLSAASDVYSVGMLMYYAVTEGKLPLEDECEDPQLHRMGGGDLPAPRKAGRQLGPVIERCIRFRAAERYQTLEELKDELENCIREMYLSEDSNADDSLLSDDPAAELERMLLSEPEEEEEEEEEECIKVYNPAPKNGPKELLSQEQTDMLARKFRMQSSPASPQYADEFEPIIIGREAENASSPLQRSAEREKKIAEEVKKRRRRPLAVILVLCAILVMVAIVMNAMLKDFQEAKSNPDNSLDTISIDPYAITMPPIETPVNTGAIGIEDLEKDEDGIPVAGHDETKDPILSAAAGDGETEEAGPVEHGYQVFKADISWTEAQKACIAQGGHLVVISDAEEYQQIVQLAEEAGITRVWIGCHRINGVDTWENSEAGYVEWAKGEPTYVDVNDQVAEDYFMLWNNGGWACNDNRDDPCADYPEFYSGTMGYICEFGD